MAALDVRLVERGRLHHKSGRHAAGARLPFPEHKLRAWCMLLTALAQLLELYAPESLEAATLHSFQPASPPPCDGEDLVFRPLKTYLSASLHFFEEESNSTLHNDQARMAIHRHSRQHVACLHAARGNPF